MSQLNLSDRHLKQVKTILRELVPHAEVWVYGSRVTGTGHEGSDLDMVIQNECTYDQLNQLRESFQESTLPFLTDIFLWSDLPITFQDNIKKNYIVIQKGDLK